MTMRVARTRIQLVSILTCLLPAYCSNQAMISLSVSSGPPTTSVQVSGRGFAPYAEVDVYFDTQDEALARADGLGSFSGIAIQTPATANGVVYAGSGRDV